MKKFVAAAVVLAAASAGVGLLLPRGGSLAAPAAVGSERAGSKEKQVAAIGADVAALKADVTRLEQKAAGAAPAFVPVAHADEHPATARDGGPRRTPDTTEVAAAYDAHFVSETVDASWSAEQESTIAAAFRGEGLKGSTLARVECRATVCRMEVDHEGSEAEEHFAQNVPLTPPFNEGGFAQRITDARGAHTVAFILREGHALPR